MQRYLCFQLLSLDAADVATLRWRFLSLIIRLLEF